MTYVSANAAKIMGKGVEVLAGEAAHKEVAFHDVIDPQYISSASARTGATPKMVHRTERRIGGDIVAAQKGDLAIDGEGHFLATNTKGVTVLTRGFSGRISTVDQNVLGPNGEKLRAWVLDSEGKVPVDSSSFDSAKPLSLKGLASTAEGTTIVAVEANLSQDQTLFDGPGDTINLAKFDAAATKTGTSIITPGENTLGSLRIGDQVTLRPGGTTGILYTFEFGGFSVSREASATNSMFKAQSPTGAFTRVPADQTPNANELRIGQTLRITVGGAAGANFDFTVSNATDKAADGEFFSLTSLAQAINESTNNQLRATIGRDNRLYVSAKDSDTQLSFSEQNGVAGRSLVQELGLGNVASNPSATTKRFNTLQELRDRITNQPQLRATYFTGKTVKFGAERATIDMDINGNSSRPTLFTHAFIGGISTDGTNDTNVRNLIRVLSPNHGLKKGDHVRIDDPQNKLGARQTDNHIYRVNEVTGDEFTFAAVAPSTALGAAVTAINTEILTHGTAVPQTSWQKVEGAFNDDDTAIGSLVAGGGTPVDISAVGNTTAGYTDVLIRLAAAGTADGVHGKHNFAAGDMVYIADSAVLKNGYYRVLVAAGGPPRTSITVQAKTAAAGPANGAADDDLLDAARPAINAVNNADANIKIIKVAQNAGTGLDVYPLTLTAGSKDVRISKSNFGGGHQYSIGDVIVFRNLAAPKLEIVAGEVEINQNTPYVIKATDNDSYTFEADGNASVAGWLIGYHGNHTGVAANAITVGVDTATETNRLGPNATIEHLGKTFKGLGMVTDADYFRNGTHTATYVATSATKNMSSNSVTPHKRHVIPVYDSFGDSHNVYISYLRLSNTEWAAEIHIPQNEDGTFDVSDANPIGNGVITFDGQGRLSSVTAGLESATFNWTNGADPSTITFDYGALLGAGQTGDLGLTQNAGDYTETRLQPNGHKAGGVERIEFETDGKVLIHYSNGVSSHYAQIPIVKVADPDGLIAIGSGHFLTSVDKSGAGILTKAGVNGVGAVVPDSLEASKVGDDVISKVNQLQYTQLLNVKFEGVKKKTMDFVLNNL